MVWEFRVCRASLRLFGRGCGLRVSGFQREFFRGRKKRDLAENTGDRALRLSGFFSFFQVSAFGLVRFCSVLSGFRWAGRAARGDHRRGLDGGVSGQSRHDWVSSAVERICAETITISLRRWGSPQICAEGGEWRIRRRMRGGSGWGSIGGRIRRLTGRPRS